MARAKQAQTTEARTVTDPKQIKVSGWLDTLTFLRDNKGANILITNGKSGVDIKATFPEITSPDGSHLMISGNPYSGRVQAVWCKPVGDKYEYSKPTYFGDVSVWNVGVDTQGRIIRIPQDFESKRDEPESKGNIPF